MTAPYNVRVESIRFSAGHFATFGGNCEPLHGHDYEVAVEATGSLTDDAWVIDFGVLSAITRTICAELDHRFMLQAESRVLEIEARETNWKVRTPAGIGYVLPASDVVALPIDNTTAERIAEWLSDRVWQELGERKTANVESLSVELWESPGKRARYDRSRLLE
jgi:6-pyruvoyltetrahydropterin/6-carboxytetrahydropterin synthase